MKRLFNLSKWIFGPLLFLLLLGYLYESISRWIYDSKEPNQSEYIVIDDRKLHFHKEGNGNATVVFESGLGGDYLHWQEIQKEVSKYTTTISYDKAGVLWSDPSKEISLERYERDLSHLLEETNCPKPYILVGHSFAGITLRSFINNHSQDIEGIIFVDVSHPQQLKRSSDELKNPVTPPSKGVMNFLNETGILRLLFTATPFTNDVPHDHWFNQNIKNYFYRILPGLQQEMENDDVLMEAAEKINDFGEIPLTIITATYPNGISGIKDKGLQQEYLLLHQSLQKELLQLSTNSKQVFATNSGHYITLQEPELIIQEIKKTLSVPLKDSITTGF